MDFIKSTFVYGGKMFNKKLKARITEYEADKNALESRLAIFEKYLARHKQYNVARKYYNRCINDDMLDAKFVARLTGENA